MAHLAATDREHLIGAGRGRRFDPGQPLVRAGAPGARVLVLVTGWARATGLSSEGREVVLAYRTAGDLIGEIAVLDGGPRLADVRAVTAVHAVEHTGPDFLAWLDAHPEADRLVRRSVLAKLREATRHRVELTGAGATLRVAHALEHLGRTHGDERADGSIEIDLPLSQTELAALVGASESSVERAMAWLRSQGLVGTGYRRYLLLEPDQLVTRASAP